MLFSDNSSTISSSHQHLMRPNMYQVSASSPFERFSLPLGAEFVEGNSSEPSAVSEFMSDVDYMKNFNKMFNSALQAEKDSVDEANALQRELFDDSNSFNAEQAKIQRDWEAEQNELNRTFQQNSADAAMRFSSDEAQIQRDWQEMMSNTSYQRAVNDLKAAGLNPVLAMMNGGAATPSGSTATGFTASGSVGSASSARASSYQTYKKDALGAYSASDRAAFNLAETFLGTINSASKLLEAILPF